MLKRLVLTLGILLLLCPSALAATVDYDSSSQVLTVTGANLSSDTTTSTPSPYEQTAVKHSESWAFSGGWECKNGVNWHSCKDTGHYDLQYVGLSLCWGYRAQNIAICRGYYYNTTEQQGGIRRDSVSDPTLVTYAYCDRCHRQVTFTHPTTAYQSFQSATVSSFVATNGKPVKELVLKNSIMQGTQYVDSDGHRGEQSSPLTFAGFGRVVIDGGTYNGARQALNSQNITVKRGSIIDNQGASSVFMIDPDSEAQVTTEGNTYEI